MYRHSSEGGEGVRRKDVVHCVVQQGSKINSVEVKAVADKQTWKSTAPIPLRWVSS